jgi:hypothetical protein
MHTVEKFNDFKEDFNNTGYSVKKKEHQGNQILITMRSKMVAELRVKFSHDETSIISQSKPVL